ncbi:MAG: ribonuclease P protein component [Magnetococcus sp. DMHC-6]
MCLKKKSNSFPKSARLLHSKQFKEVISFGKRWNSKLFVLVTYFSKQPECRLGLIVSRKVGNAVERNRVKRNIRECFRTERERLPSGLDCVVIARSESGTIDNAQQREQLLRLFARHQRSDDVDTG